MKSFQFPLQRVLDWRALQLRTEEEKLTALQYKLASLAQKESALMAAQARSERAVLGQISIDGAQMKALAAFRLRIQSDRVALRANRAQCEALIAEQRKRLLKARKDVRVLEKLKEKRWKSWQYLSSREVEDTAAENYISQWARSALEP
jgi:flagellar export protein FliJ